MMADSAEMVKAGMTAARESDPGRPATNDARPDGSLYREPARRVTWRKEHGVWVKALHETGFDRRAEVQVDSERTVTARISATDQASQVFAELEEAVQRAAAGVARR